MPDKTLTCVDCGAPFVFTEAQQEFYASKGFTNEPKRCKTCRDAKKDQTRGPKQMFETTCSQCGGVAVVPFQPKGDKPVLCDNCFRQQRGR